MIFDGKAFAKEIEEKLRVTVTNLPTKPKIVSVLVGDDPASELYTKLKKAAAERVGIEFEVVRIESEKLKVESLASEIMRIASQRDVTGVMIQLPLPGKFRGSTAQIIESIPLEKDVDGLRWRESGIVPATVKAVLSICESMANNQFPIINNQTNSNTQIIQNFWTKRFVVVGARGAVGTPLVYHLRKRGIEVSEVEWDTPDPARITLAGEVIISCVGKAGLVQEDMISSSAIVIDVGMSTVNNQAPINNNQTNQNNQNFKQFGDWNLSIDNSRRSRVVGDMTQEVYQMSSIAVGVPGGVGPVTIASLLSNAVEIYGLSSRKP